MLTRIRLQLPGENTDYLDFDYGLDTSVGGYELKYVTGLEPPPVSVNYSEYARVPGGKAQSTSVGVRNLVITGEIFPTKSDSVLELRRKLYQLLNYSEYLPLRLWNDSGYEMRIVGGVETVEYDMFTKSSLIRLSVVCPDPYFQATHTTFLNEQSPGSVTVNNAGDVSVGIIVRFRLTRGFDHTLRLYNDTTGDSFSVYNEWSSTDVLWVRTGVGVRSVTRRNRSGVVQDHLLGTTTIVGSWPLLVPGENRLRVESAGTGWTWDLEYLEQYSGF